MPSSAVDISHTINLSDAGLVLGGETRLARFADKTDRLAFDTERLTGLLSVAFGQPPSYRSLAAIAAAATDWQLGDKALANLRLVFSGLPRLDAPEDIYRLKAAEILFDAGLTAADLAETLGFDPQDDDFGKGYNSAQPRVPAGSGPTSGQWTKLWARFSAWLNEDVPEYDQDTGTQVGTRSRARAIATNPLTWIAGGAAVLAGAEIVAATPAVGEAASLAVDAPVVLPAIEEAEALTPFVRRYLSTSGGRLGSTETRQQLYEIAQTFVKTGKYEKYCGDGKGAEEYIPGSGPGTKGSTYVDFTARTSEGQVVRVQTVDTLADGLTATKNELDAAARIRAAHPNDQLILIPKRRQ